ncbi:MAG: class I SAM-dependent methyltransferase [Candidatus Methanomethylicaceae archaeon]
MAKLIRSRLELIREYAPPGRWAEFGVEWGAFAKEMLKRKDVEELWLIDCWRPYPDADLRDPAVLDEVRGEAAYTEVMNTIGRDLRVRIVRDLIESAACGFPCEFFDFAYLDAGHRYKHVQRQLELIYPLVRKGGMLAGHDYWKIEGFPWIEVREAVDEFCHSRHLEIALISDEPCGSFAIIKS